MVKLGSSLEFAHHLNLADLALKAINKSATGQRLTEELLAVTSQMSCALKANDFNTLLDMEKLVIQRDFRVFGTELAQRSENEFKQIMERWTICSDPQKAREDFIASYAPENLPKAKIMDSVMERLIKTQCRRLTDYAKGNASPAEKLYFSRRSECLKAVYKEHIHHLEQALGKDRDKSKDRGLSR